MQIPKRGSDCSLKGNEAESKGKNLSDPEPLLGFRSRKRAAALNDVIEGNAPHSVRRTRVIIDLSSRVMREKGAAVSCTAMIFAVCEAFVVHAATTGKRRRARHEAG